MCLQQRKALVICINAKLNYSIRPNYLCINSAIHEKGCKGYIGHAGTRANVGLTSS